MPREEGVVAHVEDDVEVARRAAALPALALAGHAELRAFVDAGRDAHLQRPLVRDPPLTRAGLAGVLR